MTENIAKQIDKALKYYGVYSGAHQGEYLSTVDRLSNGYEGGSLSERVSSLIDDYLKTRNIASIKEASEMQKDK